MVQTHQSIDERSLAMDRLIAAKVRQDPLLVNKAREILLRWMASADPSVLSVFKEWKTILEQPLEEILVTLQGEDERSTRLRQSSPFCGILSREERTRILLEYERRESISA